MNPWSSHQLLPQLTHASPAQPFGHHVELVCATQPPLAAHVTSSEPDAHQVPAPFPWQNVDGHASQVFEEPQVDPVAHPPHQHPDSEPQAPAQTWSQSVTHAPA